MMCPPRNEKRQTSDDIDKPTKKRQTRIVLLGAGHVATHLSHALQRAGYCIAQIYSRTTAAAEQLAQTLDSAWTTHPAQIIGDADLYLFALKDDALASVLAAMTPNEGLWIHTSGSLPQTIFAPYTARYGVLYPLQTFSKQRPVDFEQIPCFVEAKREEDQALLLELAHRLSSRVMTLSSEKRRHLHLAAVFACNFTNHLYRQAEKIVQAEGLSFDLLLPLIDETAQKIHVLSPREAQTGPAVRYDQQIIDQQLSLITDAETRAIYQLISKNIHKESTI